ncbi:MarR family transcriptional regulator [Olsenella uli]|nr:MarR family transcriptional regulator [Olsenella uli]MBM6676688.1 MarR family transcriptional regulator [Olsenella uli]
MEGGAVPDTQDRPASAREIDVLYRESDKLYYELARGCGLSETAYWIIYALEASGGSVTQRQIAGDFSYSKQTVNSALKTLAARGLVELVPAENDRRTKLVSLTPAGRAFADERVRPAIAAEDRAFTSLAPAERAELLRLVRAYASAIDAELAGLREGRGQQ